METPTNAEIRIVRRKKGHNAHHGGAWKVAFADFMTAMMAFFLVMWICGMDTNVKSAVEAYFQDPIAFKEAVSKGNAPFAISDATVGFAGGGLANSNTAPTVTVQITSDSKALGSLKSKIEKLIAETPEFKKFKDFVDISLTGEGLQIELLEASKSMFFDSGSATVKPTTRLLLLKLAKELSKVDNKMIIEGHTDSLPLRKADGYSNWELSADRANGARRILENGGITHGQIVQVRGMADNALRDPEHPESFINRRVSIVLLYKKATDLPSDVREKGVISIPQAQEIDKSQTMESPKKATSKSTKKSDTSIKPGSTLDGTNAYTQPPLPTGKGDKDITVVTREGKVYKVKSTDLTEGLIPKPHR